MSAQLVPAAEPDFVVDAREFARRVTGTLAFRLMRAHMRCSEEEITQVAAKVYCIAVPSSTVVRESPLKRYLGLFMAPFFLLARKSWWWTPEPPADWQLDVEDARYFAERFQRVHDALPGSVRVGPRSGDPIADTQPTAPVDASVTPRAWWLLIAMPLAWFSLALLCKRERLDVFRAFRGAWISYTVWEGYFRRYPCRTFITYADDGNEPSRALAFRQAGGERLVAVQNGERALQPAWACGDVDLYLMFGPYYERLIRQLGYQLGATASVGSVALDRYFAEADGPEHTQSPFDVVLLDSGGLEPSQHSGLSSAAVGGEEHLFSVVGGFATKHPEFRVACQMRPYSRDADAVTRAVAAELLGEQVELLGNTGAGESYAAVRRATVVVNYQSTMGYESFLLGATVLFVNYSGLSDQTLCDDPRYQIATEAPDFAAFDARVLDFLANPLSGPPPVALDHICRFDGHTQERIVEVLLGNADGAETIG